MTVESVSSPAVCGGDWPPGFRFHPTDEELVLYYLKRKICRKKLKLNIIAELDVYKWDPEELPGLSLLRTGDRQWYFFSTRDRRYPNGARSNRATGHGYWKATGKDRNITSNSRSVGVKKTLVFYGGRAPSGTRTDWVMHEYTLDEEEFKRCQNVKDYYALYKVYKKSGSGPKNGEQYGAPFREEEWADDDGEVVKATKQQDLETLSRELPAVTSVVDVSGNDHFQLPLDDLEELLNECFVPEHDQIPFCGASPDPSVSTVDMVSSTQQDDLMAAIEWELLGTPQNQQNDGSEVTYAPQNYTFAGQTSGDFLEIDDLIGPEPTVEVVNKPVEELSFEEIGGLSELDMYQDAAMFLQDMGPLDQGINEANVFDYGMFDQSCYQMPHQQPNIVSADPNTNHLWGNDTLSWVESVQAAQPHPHPSGLSCDDSIVLNNGTQNQNQNGTEGGGGRMSQFSSAVWSFVESIPTNPAAASENALMNKAFERMSSFGRVRVNSMSANVGAAAAVVVRRRKSRGIVLLVYVVGVLGALFGVLIGFLRLWQKSVPA